MPFLTYRRLVKCQKFKMHCYLMFLQEDRHSHTLLVGLKGTTSLEVF